MKPGDIVVGTAYTDGTTSRLVLAEGPQFRTGRAIDVQDHVQVERLDGPRIAGAQGTSQAGRQVMHLSRASMAKWARRRLTDAELTRFTRTD